jgi:hypothetical protein
MQDTGKKETVTVSPTSLIDFSFVREAQKELKQQASGNRP